MTQPRRTTSPSPQGSLVPFYRHTSLLLSSPPALTPSYRPAHTLIDFNGGRSSQESLTNIQQATPISVANSKGLFFCAITSPTVIREWGRALLQAGILGPGCFSSVAAPFPGASASSTASSASDQHVQGCRGQV